MTSALTAFPTATVTCVPARSITPPTSLCSDCPVNDFVVSYQLINQTKDAYTVTHIAWPKRYLQAKKKMIIKHYILIILSIALLSCVVKKTEQKIIVNKDLISNTDLERSALHFSEKVLKENLRVRFHERLIMNYFEVQMLFETDDLIGYTSYFDKRYQDNLEWGNYEGFILFVATYKNSKSAEYAFNHLKSNSEIRLSELEGMAGLVVEQVQVLERIRMSGGMFTQKGKYIFYLAETCGEPSIGGNWSDYENLFLEFITEDYEEIEVINADCGMDKLIVQKIKASR